MGHPRAREMGEGASPLPLWHAPGARLGGGGGLLGEGIGGGGSGQGGAELRQRNSTVDVLRTRDVDPCALSEILCRKFLGVNFLDFLLACVALLVVACCCCGCYRRWRRRRRRGKVKVSVLGTTKGPPAPARPRKKEGGDGEGDGQGGGEGGERRAGVARQERRDSVVEKQQVDRQAKQTALMIELKANQLREVALAAAKAEALEQSKNAPKRTLGQMAAQAMSMIPIESSKVSALIDEEEAGDKDRGFGGLYGIERIVGKHVKPILGMRVTRCRPRHADESSGDYEKRLQARGTVVWVDERDLDGDGKTGDLTAVVWDATGTRDVHMTGLSGVYELALARGPEGMAKSAEIFRKAVSVILVKPKPWRGLGNRGKPASKGETEGENVQVDEDEALHEVITMDRRGIRKSLYRGRESYEGVLGGTKLSEDRRARGGGMESPHPQRQPVSSQPSGQASSPDSQGGGGGGAEASVQEPFGRMHVTVVGGERLPLNPIRGFRMHRKAFVAASVRGQEVLRTEVFEDECNPVWEVRGKGTVWGKGDTVQVDLMEIWGGKGHTDKVGSVRLYVDDVWPELGGWEGTCPKCEGLGHAKRDEKVMCESCVWTGKCFHKWIPLELCANKDARLGVHVKFVPANPPVEKVLKWRAAKEPDELHPAQLDSVSAHDSRAAEEWRKAIKKCRRELRMALQSDDNEADALARALRRAEELGLYTKGAAQAPPDFAGSLLDSQAMFLARSAGERLQQLKEQQRRMPATAQGLQASIERWSSLATRVQKHVVVQDVSRLLQKDLREAAALGMHRMERFKPVVKSSMMVLGEVEKVLDEVVAAEEAHEMAKIRREQELKQSKQARKAHKKAKKAARADALKPKQDFPTILETTERREKGKR